MFNENYDDIFIYLYSHKHKIKMKIFIFITSYCIIIFLIAFNYLSLFLNNLLFIEIFYVINKKILIIDKI